MMYEISVEEYLDLQEKIEKLTEENHRLATTVLMVTYDAHPAYPNTAGPRGGIGGQAITPWCNVINGYEKDDAIWQLGIHTADAREVIKREEFDYVQMKADLMAEWLGALN